MVVEVSFFPWFYLGFVALGCSVEVEGLAGNWLVFLKEIISLSLAEQPIMILVKNPNELRLRNK